MLPISAETFPNSSDELVAALEGGLSRRGIAAQNLAATGGEFPEIENLEIDLTGAHFTKDFRVSTDAGAPAVRVAQFGLSGTPLLFENTALAVELAITNAAFGFAGAPQDGSLCLRDAGEGHIVISVEKSALETLAQTVASQAAAKQGVDIKQVKLDFTARGSRALAFRVDVTAKVFVMSAAVSLTGDLEVDEQLTARISNLKLGGDGMITAMAGSYVQPYLDKLQARSFPLLAFAHGTLRLRDVELSVADALEVRAKFGS